MTLQELESSEDFKNASYAEQSELRRAYATEAIQSEEYASLSPIQKYMAIEKVVSKAPVFNDFATQDGTYAMGEAILQGDEEAIKVAERIVRNEAAQKGSLLVTAAEKFIINPWVEAQKGAEGETEFIRAYQLPDNKESGKVVEYASYMLQTHTDSKAQAQAIALGIGVSIAEAALLTLVGAGASVAPRNLGKVALVVEKYVLDSATKATSRTALAALAKAGTHAAVTGAIGATAELTKESIRDLSKEKNFQQTMGNMAKYFGTYFAFDLVANGVMDIAFPMMKGQAMIFKRGLKGEKFLGDMPEKQFKDLVNKVMLGQDIDPGLLKTLPKETQETIFAQTNTMRVLRDLPDKMGENEALTALGRFEGVNIYPDGDEWVAGIPGVLDAKGYPSMAQAKQAVNNTLVKFKNLPVDDAFADTAAADPRGIVQTLVKKGKVSSKVSNNPGLMNHLFTPKEGKLVGENIEAFGTLLAKELDPKSPFRFKTMGDSVTLFKGEQALKSFDLNTKVGDISKEIKKFVSPLMDFTTSFSAKEMDVITAFNETLGTAQTLEHISIGGMKAMLKKTGGVLEELADGIKKITLPNGKEFASKDLGELTQFLTRSNLSFDDAKAWLRRNGRLKLTESPLSGELKVTTFRGELVASGKDLPDLLAKNPQWNFKIPERLAPKFGVVDNAKGGVDVEATWEMGGVSGSYQKLLKTFNKYQKELTPQKTATFTFGGDKTMRVNKVSKVLTVENKHLNTVKEFTSMEEAKNFLKHSKGDYDALLQNARDKGFRLDTDRGGFELLSIDGEKKIFHSFDEVENFLRETPIPEFIPELTGVNQEYIDTLVAGIKNAESPFFTKPPDFTGRETMEALAEKEYDILEYSIADKALPFVATAKRAFERFAAKGRPEALNIWKDTEAARAFVRTQERELGKLSRTIFSDSKGKLMKRSRRVAVGEYILAQTDSEKEAVKQLHNLTDAELLSARNLRSFYGENPSEGLFSFFGVEQKDFVQNYLPRIKKTVELNKGKIPTDGSIEDFMKLAFGEKRISGVDAFFKHQRVSDVVSLAYDNDPLSQLMRYNQMGLKEQFLNPHLAKMQILHKKVNDDASGRLFKYFESVYGIPTGNAEKMVRDVTPMILRKMPGMTEGMTNNIVNLFTGNMYTATMAFRPWLPIRNSLQIWTTLAPRVGNEWVVKGLKRLSKEGDEIFEQLARKGVINKNLPIYASDIAGEGGAVGQFIQKGMMPYKSSDDFTRVVAYLSVEEKFTDALNRVGKDFDMDDFGRISGISKMSENIEGDIMNHLSNGDLLSAKEVYAREMVKETMFDYTSGSMGLATKGMMGKLFGMMGTYPAYYTDNVIRGFSRGSTSEKAAFAATWVGNCTAIYGAFKAIGVKADSFLFWNPMVFTGGPGYELMNMALTGLDSGQRGSEARAKLLGVRQNSSGDGLIFDPTKSELLKLSVPASYQFKSIYNGAQALANGDVYKAGLHFTSAPQFMD